MDTQLKNPLVSIIVPVYNMERYLQDCIDSVINQEYENWELILIDDGSSDRSGDICDRNSSKDCRIKTWHIINSGLSGARNYGLSVCSGEFVFFLDADDVLPGYSISHLTYVLNWFGGDIVMGKIRRVGDDNILNELRNEFEVKEFSIKSAISETLYQRELVNSVNGKLFKKVLFSGDSVFRVGTWYEDLDLFYRLYIKSSKIVSTTSEVYNYRTNPTSFTNTWSDARLDVLDVVDRMNSFFEHNYVELLPAARDRKFSANYNMLLLMYKNGVDNTVAEQRCWQNIKSLRLKSLFNRRVRLKNKIGALVSYGGRPFLKFLSKSIFFGGQ